jgi:pSer/pThr/pTyr-binding forkhead associated (FHA) protein
MKLECPQCKSPVARERQRFCYRCGHELTAYYDRIDSENRQASGELGPQPPTETVAAASTPEGEDAEQTSILGAEGGEHMEITLETARPNLIPEQKATLRVLLPTGDVFDREITRIETQMGKGPRNDMVITDPAVSATHAMIRVEDGAYVISDLGSRNGTYVNGERIAEPRRLQHGDVIGIGLSKLTFRLSGYSETGAIQSTDILSVPPPVRAAPPPLTQESLAKAVIAEGLASRSDVDRLRGAGDRRLYRALIEERLTSEESLRDLMAHTFLIPIIDFRATKIDEALAASFPSRIAREHTIFPVSIEADQLILAVADPTDARAVEKVKQETDLSPGIRLATASEINQQIKLHYAPKLIGVLPSGEKLEYLIDQHEVEIGKAPHNQIVLTDPTVSNTHAVILVRDGGYSIVDLGSRNGTYVNGERLGTHAHTLRHGDAIQLGQSVLTFRNPEETTENITATLSADALAEVRRRAGIPDAEPARQGEIAAGSINPKGEPSSAPVTPAAVITPADVTPAALPAPQAVAPVSAAPAVVAAGDTASDEEKKKKKKKKKKSEEERVKAAYIRAIGGILATILSVALTVMLTIIISRMSSAPTSPPQSGNAPQVTATEKSRFTDPGQVLSFSGGTFEASGVAQVLDKDSVLFIADSNKREVFLMQLDQSGKQVGEIKPIPLGASITDPEGITYGGSYYYVVGSQSDPKAGEGNVLVRFAFDAASQAVVGQPEIVQDLRGFLIANVPELVGEGEKAGQEGGLNIEGIAWDPVHERLVLGLRSPVVNGQALLVPLKLRDPRRPLSNDNLMIAEPRVAQLPLGGLGVRDITYDRRLQSFLIIAGAPETLKKTDFKLWTWSTTSAPREEVMLDESIKPEGITTLRIGGRDFLFIVGDASKHLKLEYSEAQ